MHIVARINELLQRGEIFCLATVIESGDSKIPSGSKVIVLEDGSIERDPRLASLDSTVREIGLEVIQKKVRRRSEIKHGVRMFFDLLSAGARLLICGAGHIAVPLAGFARTVGFQVTVLDDRSDFAHPERFPGCEVVAENFTLALREMTLDYSTYVVVITRGHEHDVDCLTEILPKQTAYIGLIGSRRRVGFVLETLKQQGISQKRLKDVFTPIGTPIGAESPEEIALSIIAELICVRRKGPQQARILRHAVGIEP